MTSVRRVILFFCFLIFCEMEKSDANEGVCSYRKSDMLYQLIGQDTPNITVTSILDFLESHINELEFAKYQDLIFVIGSEQSDKTTLALFLADAELEAVETKPCSTEFIFNDKDGPLNEYPSNIVSELIPQLIVDKRSGAEFYILPEFATTDDVKIDLTRTHLMQRLLKFSKGIKFLFTLSYSSIKDHHGYDERKEIRELAKKATKLIKDIEKYKNTFSLVVTNFENNPNTDDKEQIKKVAYVLELTIDDFVQKKMSPTISLDETESIEKCMLFLEILSKTAVHGHHPKIKVFRLANETGLVDDMQIFKNEKLDIRTMIQQTTQFVDQEDKDFYYEISMGTKERIGEIFDEVKKRVSADISNINLDIKNIYTQMEKDTADIYALYEKMKKGNEVIDGISTSDPKIFVQQIIAASDELEIEISTTLINDILKHIELTDFLVDLQKWNALNISRISNKAVESIKYLNESTTWYAFLIKLQDVFSEYEVQKNVVEYEKDSGIVIALSTIEINEEKNVSDIGLVTFLERVGVGRDIYSMVEGMTVNSFKLESLKELLRRNMNDYGTLFCSPEMLVVKGYNVKISDVIKMQCPGNIKFKEIFALNKVYIDADIDETGNKIQLVIIAPTWNIIGWRKIILNGHMGEAHTKHEGEKLVNGRTGSPGRPGGSAGCFMAIGNKFINDHYLTVYLNGGKGGAGQNGEPGDDGKKGENPPIPEASYMAKSKWDQGDFIFYVLMEDCGLNLLFQKLLISVYIVNGKRATYPGKGGDGGVGGLGGLEGQAVLVKIHHLQPNFRVIGRKGDNGTEGKFGVGGSATSWGDVVAVTYPNIEFFFVITWRPAISVNEKGEYVPRGENGESNKNEAGRLDPLPAEFVNPSHSVNRYKSFIRENLAAKYIQESKLRNFMNDIEVDERIQSLYDTMGFFNELLELENQYLQFRNHLPFIPFYKSMISRTAAYSKSNNESTDHQKVLRFLHTAMFAKISNLRNFRAHASVISLFDYLKIVQKNIDKMREIDKETSIEEQRQQYHDGMTNKINSAIEIVNTQIVPAIFAIFEPLGSKIIDLIEIVVAKREQAKRELEELERTYRSERLFGAFKVFGEVLQCFGTVATAIGMAIQLAAEFTQSVWLAMSRALTEMERATNPLKEYLKQPYILYLQQLQDMILMMPKGNSRNSDWDELHSTISKHITLVQNKIDEKGTVDTSYVMNYRQKVDNAITKTNCKGGDCAVKDKMGRINKLAEVSLKIYNAVKDENDKLAELENQIANMQGQLDYWNGRLKMIEQKLFPLLVSVELTIIELTGSLANQTTVEMDVTEWHVQAVMGDLKMLAQQASEGTSISDDFVRLIEKIAEAFSTLITVYNRIQSYIDQSKFADYLAHINSADSQNIANPKLRNSVMQIRKVIQSNVIIEQYEVAIHSFKQHYFPFATIYLATFDLPTGLQVNDTEILVRRASEEIDYLQEQVKFLEISIGNFDIEVFGDIDFDSTNINIAVPFYTFKSREFKSEIRNLLNGEEIMIKADITKGLNQNAIKFNEIGIKLTLQDNEMQTKLDANLEDFAVRMTLVGQSYYQCGDKFFSISVDDRVVIEKSFKRNINGKPKKFNEVYRKLNENHYFLSPYAIWKIKLIAINEDFGSIKPGSIRNHFDKLLQFKDEAINLELVGRGQYFRNSGTLASEICTNEMDKYYDFDETMYQTKRNMQQIKYMYLPTSTMKRDNVEDNKTLYL